MNHEKLVILDFGSQYTQLIARKVRKQNVYCEIVPFYRADEIEMPKALILSGSPFSCLEKELPEINLARFIGHIPVLGICFGAQIVAHRFGGEVGRSQHREYGKANLQILSPRILFEGVSEDSQIWMSHGDSILQVPEHAQVIAETKNIPVAAYHVPSKDGDHDFYGIQFHPEVTHSLEGEKILENFLLKIAGFKQDWTADLQAEEAIAYIKENIDDDAHVLMALSGGVDSTVAATLIHRAIGNRLHCVFVDTGLMRLREFESVEELYKKIGLNIHGIQAKNRFFLTL